MTLSRSSYFILRMNRQPAEGHALVPPNEKRRGLINDAWAAFLDGVRGAPAA
jgi:hypothetical protein